MQIVRDFELDNGGILERYVGRDLSDVSRETQCGTCSKCLTVQGEIQKKIVFYTDTAGMSELGSEYTACMRSHPFIAKPDAIDEKISSTLPLVVIPSIRVFQKDCPDYLPDSVLWSGDFESMSDEQVGRYVYYWGKYCDESEYKLNAIEKNSLEKLLTYLMREHGKVRLRRLRTNKSIKTSASQGKISQLFDKDWVVRTDFVSIFQDSIQQS